MQKEKSLNKEKDVYQKGSDENDRDNNKGKI